MNQAHHPVKGSIKSIIFLYLISTAFTFALPAQGQITPDNSLGGEASRLNQNQIINGAPGDEIDGGATRGSNLFHSFSEFNINEGQRVYFAKPTGVENILTRVTGGKITNIFGTLGVDGAANLFLMNPAGIVFGQNAKLDLQGSFVGTTADGVQLGNQELFSATNPQTPSLLAVGVPVGLQYGSNPGIIQAQGATLQVPNGQSLNLAGGAVNIDGGQLLAPGGRVELGGVSAAGTLGLNADGSLSFPNNLVRADVSLSNAARVDVRAGSGGSITVNARNVEITEGSQLLAGIREGLGTPDTTAGDITIDATDTVTFVGKSKDRSSSGAYSQVAPRAEGKGGNISITTSSLAVTNGAQLDASTEGQGDAGSVTISATDAINFDSSSSGAYSQVVFGANGKGGNISITTSSLSLTNGAQLNTGSWGVGDAGNITIIATDAIKFDGEKSDDFSSGVFTVAGGIVGKAGDVSITTGSLAVTNGANIFTNSGGTGDAGNITINAKDKIMFDGSQIYAYAGSESEAENKAGDISITTGSLELLNRTFLGAYAVGKGDAGRITINARGAVKFDGSFAYSAVQEKAEGNSRGISINTHSLEVLNGGQLSASTNGKGNVGKGIA